MKKINKLINLFFVIRCIFLTIYSVKMEQLICIIVVLIILVLIFSLTIITVKKKFSAKLTAGWANIATPEEVGVAIKNSCIYCPRMDIYDQAIKFVTKMSENPIKYLMESHKNQIPDNETFVQTMSTRYRELLFNLLYRYGDFDMEQIISGMGFSDELKEVKEYYMNNKYFICPTKIVQPSATNNKFLYPTVSNQTARDWYKLNNNNIKNYNDLSENNDIEIRVGVLNANIRNGKFNYNPEPIRDYKVGVKLNNEGQITYANGFNIKTEKYYDVKQKKWKLRSYSIADIFPSSANFYTAVMIYYNCYCETGNKNKSELLATFNLLCGYLVNLKSHCAQNPSYNTSIGNHFIAK